MNYFISVALIAAGLFLIFYQRNKISDTVTEVQFLQTKTIDEVQKMFTTMDDMSMGENYREYVELKADVVSNCAVQTPYSQRDVAFYTSTLSQVSEISEQYKDKDGCMRTKTSKRENKISDAVSSQTIEVTDASSEKSVVVELMASGCDLDIPKTFDKFEPKNNMSRYNGFMSSYRNTAFGSETLGFKMTEKTIELGQKLYILGEAFREGDKIYIGKPQDSKKPFIVSTKSEEDLVNTHKKKAMMTLIGGIALCVLGVVLILTAIF